eukprot:TCONS_00026173-protein
MAGLMCRNFGLFRTSNLNFALKNVSKSLKNRTIILSVTSNEKETGSLFQRFWDSVDVSAPSDAHSKTLTDNNSVTYEIIFDVVKPEFKKEYLKATSEAQTYLNDSKEYPGQLQGSWSTIYGDMDQSVHLWMYNGYSEMSKKHNFESEDEAYQEYARNKAKWLNSRRNQICHHFGYWGEPTPRQPSHIYEMRSYTLKPGTLIEWSNNWGQAISIRRKDAVGGFFSQIGDLYQVHHVWAYRDLEHRQKAREKMWQQPGWDDCVAATVPLVRDMKANILKPNPHSPMQ